MNPANDTTNMINETTNKTAPLQDLNGGNIEKKTIKKSKPAKAAGTTDGDKKQTEIKPAEVTKATAKKLSKQRKINQKKKSLSQKKLLQKNL